MAAAALAAGHGGLRRRRRAGAHEHAAAADADQRDGGDRRHRGPRVARHVRLGPRGLHRLQPVEPAAALTFETDELGGDTGGIRRSTREIAPRSTGELKVDPPEGTYRLIASSGDVNPASIEVSARRESAQGELLLP